MVQANPNILPGSPAVPVPNTPSTIGDGRYNREDVVWNRGGNTNAGNPAAIPARIGASFGCTSPGVSDNRDQGKSPQDANNDPS
ncbi:MAG: hypothetical protein JNN15_19835, partial [Blastocatellia bacterium]|nr:hypothetical protein [Blastocatellia bacterium]